MNRIVIGIIEDNNELVNSLKGYIQSIPNRLTISWNSAEEYFKNPPDCKLDVLILDIGLKGMSGLEFLKEYQKNPDQKTIIISSICTDDVIITALKYGASSYLWKSDLYSINDALQIVLDGGSVITPTIAAKVLQLFRDTSSNEENNLSELESLSSRERQILDLILEGEETGEIAGLFGTSIGTVRQQIKSIYKKLQVNSKIEMVLKAKNSKFF